MRINRSKEKLMLNMVGNLIIGTLLITVGILLGFMNSTLIENKKALIGLSIVPFGVAIGSLLNLYFIKKFPEGMKSIIVFENDERVIAKKNEADSITFRILRWGLTLVFLGYTFMFPKDIFEAPSWWMVFIFFFMSHVLQGIILSIFYKRDEVKDSE